MMRDVLIAVALFGGLVSCLEFWYYLGCRARARHEEHPDQLATVQGATLGLLALLLGFSFALAAGRFSDRVQLIVREANAIGTAYLRCDLLPDQRRDQVRQMLRDYTAQRIAYYDRREENEAREAIQQSEALHAQMWPIVADAAKATPGIANVLLPAFNEVIDLHGARLAASRRHLPVMVTVLLLACSLVSVASVGYGCGVAGKRNFVLTTALAFLIAGVLWAIIDMDHPRKGLIRVGQEPMLDLQRIISK